MKKKLLLTFVSIFIVLMLISSICLKSYASLESDKKEVQKQINDTKNQINELKEDEKEAKTELSKVTNSIEEVENRIKTIKLEIEELNNSINDKQKEIEEEEKEIERKDELLKTRMVALYEKGDTSFLDVLFNSENLIDFLSSYSILQQIIETDTELINELEEGKKKLEEDKSKLEDNKKEVENKKAEQEISKANLLALEEKKKSEINKLNDEERAKQKELDEQLKKQKEIDDAIAEAFRKAQEEEAKNNNSSTNRNGSKFNGTFIWPLDYSPRRVTSRMKFRWGRWHKGIDIGTNGENGKRVVAAADGTVIYSAYQGGSSGRAGYGNWLIIYHGDGYCSLYAHMQSKSVSIGQRVSQGQLIGYSGSTGGVAPHLHFEIRRATSVGNFFGKNWLDPLDYLPGGYTLAPGA